VELANYAQNKAENLFLGQDLSKVAGNGIVN
jgi:hypothetical protein